MLTSWVTQFRSTEVATTTMAFDGIFINVPMKVHRPKDYGGLEMIQASVHFPVSFPPMFPTRSCLIILAGENNTMDARISLMLNMVTPEDRVDDQEYGDLYEDVKEESFRYGVVEDLRIPQPVKKDKTAFAFGDMAFRSALDAQCADEFAGVGRVYVKFVNAQDAQSALKVLTGRSFAGRSIIVTVLNEDSQMTPPLKFDLFPTA